MSINALFLPILLVTLIVHLGKFVDWLLGPKQERLKRDFLTDVYTFLELDQLASIVNYSIALLVQFMNTSLGQNIRSTRWLVRVTVYSLSLNFVFGMVIAWTLAPNPFPSSARAGVLQLERSWSVSLIMAMAMSTSLLPLDVISLAIVNLLLKCTQSRNAYARCGYLFALVVLSAAVVLIVPAVAGTLQIFAFSYAVP